MGIVRSGCYECIKSLNVDNFYYPFNNDIDKVIRFYILALKQGYYSNDFSDEHYAFVFNHFDMIFSTNNWEANIKTRDHQEQNTYLHEVCNSTPWGSTCCEKLFIYFLNKGIDPFIKNCHGQMCFDLIKNEWEKKKIINLTEYNLAENKLLEQLNNIGLV